MNEIGHPNEETQWIERSVSGDAEAFGCLVTKYQNRLFNSMVHFLRDEAEAEDVVQESLVLAYTRLNKFRGNSSFYTCTDERIHLALDPPISSSKILRVTGGAIW